MVEAKGLEMFPILKHYHSISEAKGVDIIFPTQVWGRLRLRQTFRDICSLSRPINDTWIWKGISFLIFFFIGEILCCSLNLMLFFTISYPLFIDVWATRILHYCCFSKNDTMWQQKELKNCQVFFKLICFFFLVIE
jgi:hypothetical protein